jgi:Protein of unknown function (DUF1579)
MPPRRTTVSRSSFAALLVPLFACLLTGTARPQDKKDDKKDPLQSFEPKSKPGAGQKFLEKFVGEWDVVKSFHPRKGEPVRATGECKQTMIHDGRFLQSEFTFKTDAGKTTGLGLIGFQPETEKFTSVWTDSRQTRMSFRQGEDKFDGEQIVLFGKELDGKEGRRSKTVTRLEDDGKKIVHRQYAVEAGAPDRLVMELVMTKKADAPKPAK